MDIPTLRMFCAVAQTGSVSAAAELLNTVQSNISTHVRKLEEEVRAPLFHREARGMRLTPAGEVLLEYANRILALTEEANSAMNEMMDRGGVLRLASMEMTAAAHLPPLLTRFHHAFPKTKLTLITDTSEACIEAVLERRVDLAFVAGPVGGVPVQITPAFREELVLAVPGCVTTLEEALARTLLAFRLGSRYQDCVDDWLRLHGGWPSPVLEFSSLDMVLHCITGGMGVSIVPRKVVERLQHLEQISALPLDDAPFIEIYLVQHKDCVSTGAKRAFRKIVQETYGLPE
jgi:LysR family transcriptional regulator, cell division regulator